MCVSVAPQVGGLQALTYLRVDNNYLRGSVPYAIYGISTLTVRPGYIYMGPLARPYLAVSCNSSHTLTLTLTHSPPPPC